MEMKKTIQIGGTTKDRGAPLKFKEICAAAGTGESTMRKLIADGKGPKTFKRPGGRHILSYEDDVLAWLSSARRAAA